MAAAAMTATATDGAVSWPRVAVASLIAVVWSVIMLVDAFSTTFTAPAQSSAALGVVAYLFGRELRRVANGDAEASA